MTDKAQPLITNESLTVSEFARKHKVGRSTVWSWIEQGLLVATKIGPNCTRILAVHEQAWLAGPKADAERRAAANREKAA
jgi:hypothetical protein